MTQPSKYTPERVRRVLDAILSGSTRETAALAAGIGRRTLYRWLERYPAFVGELEQAEAQVELRMTSIILQAAEVDARHAEWWLERRRPDDYARRDKLDLEVYIRQRARELGLDEDEALEAVRPRLKALG